MDANSKREARIDEVLSSLDGLKRATVSPFFYTRLRAALEREATSPWQQVGYWLTRPSVALTTGLVILVMNAFLLFGGPSPAVAVRDSEPEAANVYSYVALPDEIHYTLNEEQP